MDVKLVIFKSDGARKDIAVAPGRYIVGRKPDASIRVPLASVSREHCEIILDNAGLRVRDLGSSNGTFRNRERVKETPLAPGDVLTVGPVSLTVQIDGQPMNIKPPLPSGEGDDDSAFDMPTTALKPIATPSPASAPAPAPVAQPKTQVTAPAAAAPMMDDLDDSGFSDTLPTTKKTGVEPLVSKGGQDDSSIFDFDFDFEDEDRPRL